MFYKTNTNLKTNEDSNQKNINTQSNNLIINHKTKMEKIKNIRPIFFAGSFYSSDPNELNEEIKRIINSIQENNIEENIKALILPHAGYIYSGLTA
jgi:hypothetical protein